MDIFKDVLVKQLKNAYKKYKTYIYHDNWSVIQRQNLANFERENFYKDNFFNLSEYDLFFDNFANNLLDDPQEVFDKILNDLDVMAVPKSVVDENKHENVISNYNFPSHIVDKIHYFIRLPVEGHILGVLWILRCGFYLDDKLYKNCYGNRIRSSVLKELKGIDGSDDEWYDSCTPFLFTPYFKNYSNWRDDALDSVKLLNNQEKHAVMLSLDFKDYFYSALINFNNIWKDIVCAKKNISNNDIEINQSCFNINFKDLKDCDDFDKLITCFVKKVFEEYSGRFKKNGEYPMIPLGFLPSLIISNWYLQGFDQAIVEDINPYYYGRYVDDILIVFSAHEKSDAHGEQLINELSLDDFVEKYFTTDGPKPINDILKVINSESIDDCLKMFSESSENILELINKVSKNNENNNNVKQLYEDVKNIADEVNRNHKENIVFNEKEINYGVSNLKNHPIISNLPTEYGISQDFHYENLRMQRNKLKMYIFSYKYSDAIINNFKREIRKNSSEFRMLPSVSALTTSLEENIHKIEYYESINKLKDIKNVKVNKFEISKILSRINQIFLLLLKIDEKHIENVIFAIKEHLLDYIILWEKIFTLLYLNQNYDKLLDLIKEIKKLIDNIEYVPKKSESQEYNKIKFLIDGFNGVLENFKNNEHKLENLVGDLNSIIKDVKDYECSFKLKEDNGDYSKNVSYLKDTLNDILYYSLIRVISLSLNEDAKDIYKYLSIDELDKRYDGISPTFFNDIYNIIFSSMQNNSYMKYPIQNTNGILEKINNFLTNNESDFLEYDLVKEYNFYNEDYRGIFPRYVKFHEVFLDRIHNVIFGNLGIIENSLNKRKADLSNEEFTKTSNDVKSKNELAKLQEENEYLVNLFSNKNINGIYNKYNTLNFIILDNSNKMDESNRFEKYVKFNQNSKNVIEGYDVQNITVGIESKDKLKVGLVNTKLNEKYFEYRLKGKNTLFEGRYEKLVKIINMAIEREVELLIMPEMYIPYEWVPELLKIVKQQQMMIIFGVEPIDNGSIIGNYIMTAMPFKVDNEYFECVLLPRLKNEYAPNEVHEIRKFNKREYENGLKNSYYYNCVWNGISIVPYYCFEITDILARSLFKGNCDILTVSEFNKDVNYFDKIAESLSRDLYCYCLKSNTSDYGGSEIIQPTKTETRVPVKLKGGEEDYLVTHILDLKKLREVKSKSDLFYRDNQFKPKPAGFR